MRGTSLRGHRRSIRADFVQLLVAGPLRIDSANEIGARSEELTDGTLELGGRRAAWLVGVVWIAWRVWWWRPVSVDLRFWRSSMRMSRCLGRARFGLLYARLGSIPWTGSAIAA